MCSDWCLLVERHETGPDGATTRESVDPTRFSTRCPSLCFISSVETQCHVCMIACDRKTMIAIGCNKNMSTRQHTPVWLGSQDSGHEAISP